MADTDKTTKTAAALQVEQAKSLADAVVSLNSERPQPRVVATASPPPKPRPK